MINPRECLWNWRACSFTIIDDNNLVCRKLTDIMWWIFLCICKITRFFIRITKSRRPKKSQIYLFLNELAFYNGLKGSLGIKRWVQLTQGAKLWPTRASSSGKGCACNCIARASEIGQMASEMRNPISNLTIKGALALSLSTSHFWVKKKTKPSDTKTEDEERERSKCGW